MTLMTLDMDSTAALVLRDSSAAFGVIDHARLLKCLEFPFGIKEVALFSRICGW